MDNLVKHLAGSPRLLSAFPQVETIGFISGKRDRVKRAFDSVNFSFILAGRGYYIWDGIRHEVIAPAVLTQWPGAPMDYGPESQWDEMYLIYPSSGMDALSGSGLFSMERVLWKIERKSEILSMAEDFFERCRSFSGSGPVDSLDMSAYALVVESLLARESDNSEPHREEIRAIARLLRSQPENYYDFEKLATEIGMSLSTFRRYFLRYYQTPPGEYQQNHRIMRARRMLVESRLNIAGIARSCGFADAMYFSRRFRIECGMSPGEYRRRFRIYSADGQ